MSQPNEHSVHALSFEAEYDFRRKSGPIELVFVMKASGDYDIYHPSDVPHLIQRLSDGKVALHKGNDRVGKAKEKFESELQKIAGDKTALKNTSKNPDDAKLTEIEMTTAKKLGIDFKDVTNEVDPILYTRLTSFTCCIPIINFYCP